MSDGVKDILKSEGVKRLPSYFPHKVMQTVRVIDRKRAKKRLVLMSLLLGIVAIMVVFAQYLTISVLDYSITIPSYFVKVLCFFVFSILAYQARDLFMLQKKKDKLNDLTYKK